MTKHMAALLVLIMCSSVLISCGVDDIDISDYKNEELILTGLSGEEKTVTVEELKKLECVTKKTESTSEKIGTVSATGPLLETIVESLGFNINDYSKIIIYGEDDYDVDLSKDFLKENQVIIAFGIDGEPLSEDSRPIRLIIPESDSAYWVRMVQKVEFIK